MILLKNKLFGDYYTNESSTLVDTNTLEDLKVSYPLVVNDNSKNDITSDLKIWMPIKMPFTKNLTEFQNNGNKYYIQNILLKAIEILLVANKNTDLSDFNSFDIDKMDMSRNNNEEDFKRANISFFNKNDIAKGIVYLHNELSSTPIMENNDFHILCAILEKFVYVRKTNTVEEDPTIYALMDITDIAGNTNKFSDYLISLHDKLPSIYEEVKNNPTTPKPSHELKPVSDQLNTFAGTPTNEDEYTDEKVEEVLDEKNEIDCEAFFIGNKLNVVIPQDYFLSEIDNLVYLDKSGVIHEYSIGEIALYDKSIYEGGKCTFSLDDQDLDIHIEGTIDANEANFASTGIAVLGMNFVYDELENFDDWHINDDSEELDEKDAGIDSDTLANDEYLSNDNEVDSGIEDDILGDTVGLSEAASNTLNNITKGATDIDSPITPTKEEFTLDEEVDMPITSDSNINEDRLNKISIIQLDDNVEGAVIRYKGKEIAISIENDDIKLTIGGNK